MGGYAEKGKGIKKYKLPIIKYVMGIKGTASGIESIIL